MSRLFSLANKVCVVTGAARGLGNTMLRGLHEAGATQSVILDVREDAAAASAAELARELAVESEGYACDVSSETSVSEAFARIKQRFGRVDVLVTSAGIVENFPAEEYPAAKVRKLLDINVMGSWLCAVEAGRLMKGDGSVVMIGSMSGSVSLLFCSSWVRRS
jgi:NAD(P)-dependent dehydrogenase (short-subunit alcohol dehydrogenase family)